MVTKGKNFLLLAIALVVLLRLPSLTDPKYYLDEGVYASVAYEIGQGGTLYKTAWDLKPPGIFLVYLFFQRIFSSQAFLAQRIFNLVLGVLGVWGVYQLTKQLRLTERGSVLAALLSAILLGLPFFETQIFNTENIFIVTSLFAFFFGLKFKNRWREPFIAGLLFGTGQWLKIHPVFDLAAFGVFALYKFKFDRKFWLPFILGILTPLLLMVVYLISNGILFDFWDTNMVYNLFYVEELPQITIFGGLPKRTVLLFGVTTILLALKFKNKISENTFLLSLWFVFVFYGALLSARTYGHYFLPLLIPFALLAAKTKLARPGLANEVLTGILAFITFVGFVILQTPVRTEAFRQKIFSEQFHFYQHRLSYLTGRIDKREFEKDFTPKPWRMWELKKHLDATTSKDDRVYIWGISPWANYVLDRRPVQRYLMWFHILGVGNREEEVLKDLLIKMPEVIIVEANQPEGESYEISRPPFLELQNLIDTNYKFESSVAGYNIYRLTALAVNT